MSRKLYRFREFELDRDARQLRRDGHAVTLEPKVFDCIVHLLLQRERVVGRDELVAVVWERVDVSDAVLSQAILKARRAVGDTGGEHQRTIMTMPRVGYRWIAPVEVVEHAAAPAAVTPTSGDDVAPVAAPSMNVARGHDHRVIGIAGALAVVAIAAWWLFAGRERVGDDGATPASTTAASGVAATSPSATPSATTSTSTTTARPDTILVLPVTVRSTDPALAWLRLGAMDAIRSRLGEAIDRPLISSESSIALDATPASIETHFERSGAAVIAQAEVVPDGARWLARGLVHRVAQAPLSLTAHADDPVGAARALAGEIAIAIGGRPLATAAPGDALADAIARIRAATLAGQNHDAQAIIAALPDAMRAAPPVVLLAADVAQRLDQRDAATDGYRRLLATTQKDAHLRARAQIGLGKLDLAAERYTPAESAFAAAVAIAPQPDDLATALMGLAIAQVRQGRFDDATTSFARARVQLEPLGDRLALANLRQNEATLASQRNQVDAALPALESAVREYEALGARQNLVAARINLSNVYTALMQFDRARDNAAIVAGLVADTDHFEQGLRARINLAQTMTNLGELGRAQVLLDGAVADAARTQRPELESTAQMQLAWIARDRRDWAEAERRAMRAIALADGASDLGTRVDAEILLAQSLAPQGRDEEAARHHDRAIDLATRAGDDSSLVQAQVASAVFDARRGRDDAARQRFAAALQLADRAGTPADRAIAATRYAQFLVARGELEAAEPIVGRAIQYADQDYRVALLRAQWHRARGRGALAEADFANARRLAGERWHDDLATLAR